MGVGGFRVVRFVSSAVTNAVYTVSYTGVSWVAVRLFIPAHTVIVLFVALPLRTVNKT